MLSNPLVSVLEWYHLWSLFSFWDCSGRGGPFFPLYGSVCFDEGLASQAARGPGWGCCPRGARLKWFPPHFAISGLPPSLFMGGAAWLRCGSCSEGHCRTKLRNQREERREAEGYASGNGFPCVKYIHTSKWQQECQSQKETNEPQTQVPCTGQRHSLSASRGAWCWPLQHSCFPGPMLTRGSCPNPSWENSLWKDEVKRWQWAV